MSLGTHAAPLALVGALIAATPALAQDAPDLFTPADVFELERAVDPQISPDGTQIVYVRTGADIMTDGSRTSLWILDADGSNH
jgi:hypothetical protein